MIKLLFFFCFSHVVQPIAVEDHVDYIEINHLYDERGIHLFDCLIFWDNSNRKDYKYKAVVDWKMIRGMRKPVTDEENIKLRKIYQEAKIDLGGDFKFTKFIGIDIQKDRLGRYFYMFFDKTVLRKVFAKSIMETWTQKDEEVLHKEFQAPEDRRGLSKIN